MNDPTREQLEAAWSILQDRGIDRIAGNTAGEIGRIANGPPKHAPDRYSPMEVRFARHLIMLTMQLAELRVEAKIEDEERELNRLLSWLGKHRHFCIQGVIAALEARDHRHVGYGGDERTGAIERRVDILGVIHERTPRSVAVMDIAAELGLEPNDTNWTGVDDDLHALLDAGLLGIHTSPDGSGAQWFVLADNFEEELVDAGFRMLAARSVSATPNRRSET